MINSENKKGASAKVKASNTINFSGNGSNISVVTETNVSTIVKSNKLTIGELESADSISGYRFGINDPKSLANFILSSLTTSRMYSDGNELKLDLHDIFKFQKCAGKNGETIFDGRNLQMLKEAELIMQSALSTYNKNHPKNLQLSMCIDGSSLTFNQTLSYEQKKDLVGYIFPRDIDKKIKEQNDNKNIAKSKIGDFQL